MSRSRATITVHYEPDEVDIPLKVAEVTFPTDHGNPEFVTIWVDGMTDARYLVPAEAHAISEALAAGVKAVTSREIHGQSELPTL